MHEELFKILRKDHQEVKSMLEKMKETSEDEHQERVDLFKQFKQEIVPHMRAEEKAFYSVLKENEEAKEDAMEGMEEHHAAELIMVELDKLSKADEFWLPKLSVFKEMIRHHIQEEESKIFQDAEKAISPEQMKMVLENFQKEKERVKEQAMARSRSR
jgi:hemerythrin-like domain-containing protein